MDNIGGLIVAAGDCGAREEITPLMKLGSVSVIRRIVITLQLADIQPIVVVTGYHALEVEQHLAGYNVIFIRNEDYENTDKLYSTKLGLEYLQDKCDRVVFTPVTIPLYTAETVKRLIAANRKIVVPVHRGKRGHPVLLGTEVIRHILAYNGNGGLNDALRQLEAVYEYVEEAFANSELTSVKIPATVTTIGPRAFYSADKLASVEFASGSKMTTIGEYVFNHCTALTSVALPNSVKKLDDGCFSYCFALNNITIPSGVTELGDCVFAGSALNEITLPDSIQKMGVGTFRACTKLITVKMPKNLSNLGTCTFEDCSALTGVTFPEGIKLTYVPEDTFFNCKAIKNIYLPAAIAETKACSFSNCDSNPTIEYANANLKRNIFDCYAIDPGEAYRLDDDGFYYTTEEITDSDFSEKVFEDAKGSSDTVAVNNDGTVVHGRSAGSAMATCGCGSNLGANVKLTPTSNPKFVYKKASSGMNAGGGQNGGANGGANGGQNGGNGTGNSVTGKKNTSPKVTGTAARTGDEAFLGGYIMLLVLALGSVITVVVYKKKRIGQR